METKLTREDCLELIRKKYDEKGRIPEKSDFSDFQVMMIKSHLGPWPRAMESAGVKPPRSDDKLQKRREKRLRAKQRKAEFKNNV
ncbi:MAG: homing endonuclease associated repeat-containing protein [Ruminococcus sp.]